MWTEADDMVGLGYVTSGDTYSKAYAVSANGDYVAGIARLTPGAVAPNGIKAFRWSRSSNQMTCLGDLSNNTTWSYAWAISDDGHTVVGKSLSASGVEAFKWTPALGMVGLGDLAGGGFRSEAYAISANSSVIAGYGTGAAGEQAVIWRDDIIVPLIGPAGTTASHAYALSPDGTYVVGRLTTATGDQAFIWTEGGGMVLLGDLAGGDLSSGAYGVSENGSIVVGYASSAAGKEAFIWDADHGIRKLMDALIDDGLGEQLQGWTLNRATAISADGVTIVGWGTDPSGNYEAWMATMPENGPVPEPATLALLALGVLAVVRRRR
jgi:probable HAF family extracellular repeat protein